VDLVDDVRVWAGDEMECGGQLLPDRSLQRAATHKDGEGDSPPDAADADKALAFIIALFERAVSKL
jgi:hypothetical protein